MKALNQAELIEQYNQVQAEYEASRQKMAELAARQADLQNTLTRITINLEALGTRSVPDYPKWLVLHCS